MSFGTPDRQALQVRWRRRLEDARLRLEFTRSYIAEVQSDFPLSEPLSADGYHAYLQALRAENDALAAYARVLHDYEEIARSGNRPEEHELSQTKTA